MNPHNQTSPPGQARSTSASQAMGRVTGTIQGGSTHAYSPPAVRIPYEPVERNPVYRNVSQIYPQQSAHAGRTDTSRDMSIERTVDPPLPSVGGAARGHTHSYQPLKNMIAEGRGGNNASPYLAPQTSEMAMQTSRAGYNSSSAAPAHARVSSYPTSALPYNAQGMPVMSRAHPQYPTQSSMVWYPQAAHGRVLSPDVGPMRYMATPVPSRLTSKPDHTKVAQLSSLGRPCSEPQSSHTAEAFKPADTAPRRNSVASSVAAEGSRQTRPLPRFTPTSASRLSETSVVLGEMLPSFFATEEGPKGAAATPLVPSVRNSSTEELEALVPQDVVAAFNRTDFFAVLKLAHEHIAKGDDLGLFFERFCPNLLLALRMMLQAVSRNEDMPKALTELPFKFTPESLAESDYKRYLVKEIVKRRAESIRAETISTQSIPGASSSFDVAGAARTTRSNTVASTSSSSLAGSRLVETIDLTALSPLITSACPAKFVTSTTSVQAAQTTVQASSLALPHSGVQRPQQSSDQSSVVSSASNSVDPSIPQPPISHPRPHLATGPIIAVPSAGGRTPAPGHQITAVASALPTPTAHAPSRTSVRPNDLLAIPIASSVATALSIAAARADRMPQPTPQQIVQNLYSAPVAKASLASTSITRPDTISSTYGQPEYNSSSGIVPPPTRVYSELSGVLGSSSTPDGFNVTLASANVPAHPESSKRKRDDSWMGLSTLWDQDSPVAKRARTIAPTEPPSRADSVKRQRVDSGMDQPTLKDSDSLAIKKARNTFDVDEPYAELFGETSTSGSNVHSASADAGSEHHSDVDGEAEKSGSSSDHPNPTGAEVADGIMALLAGPSTISDVRTTEDGPPTADFFQFLGPAPSTTQGRDESSGGSDSQADFFAEFMAGWASNTNP